MISALNRISSQIPRCLDGWLFYSALHLHAFAIASFCLTGLACWKLFYDQTASVYYDGSCAHLRVFVL